MFSYFFFFFPSRNSYISWFLSYLFATVLRATWEAISQTTVLSNFSLLFSCQVLSDSSWPHGLQHARLPCPSLSPGACSNSCPLSQWCHPTISSSVSPFSYPQSFPASGSFPMSQLFGLGGPRIGGSTSASVLPMNMHSWFPLGLTGDLAVQGTLKSLLKHDSSKASVLWCSAFFTVQLSHLYITRKTIALTIWTFVGKMMGF